MFAPNNRTFWFMLKAGSLSANHKLSDGGSGTHGGFICTSRVPTEVFLPWLAVSRYDPDANPAGRKTRPNLSAFFAATTSPSTVWMLMTSPSTTPVAAKVNGMLDSSLVGAIKSLSPDAEVSACKYVLLKACTRGSVSLPSLSVLPVQERTDFLFLSSSTILISVFGRSVLTRLPPT